MWAVWVVCGLNGLLFIALIALVPMVWALRSALLATAQAMDEWSEAAQGALAPTPAELLRLKQSLQESRATLTLWQRRLQFWQGIRRMVFWVKDRFYPR
ncbi:hypothetical protein L1047_13680 [Synechococcus sp. Nb3U1]|nr:hypothetical protein [Synechococcus sp. Nb3U1]